MQKNFHKILPHLIVLIMNGIKYTITMQKIRLHTLIHTCIYRHATVSKMRTKEHQSHMLVHMYTYERT